MTTDSFVVKPIRFPGGSIGELAVNGTVNDLAVAGRPAARADALAGARGGPRRRRAARRGRGDRRGRARPPASRSSPATPRSSSAATATRCTSARPGSAGVDPRAALSPAALRPGDRILVSGPIGEHGTAIMLARGEFELDADDRVRHALAVAGRRRAARRRRRRRCAACATRPAAASPRCSTSSRAPRAWRCVVREAAVPVRPAVAGAARSSGSTRCTSPTRASSSPSSRPSAADAALGGAARGRRAASGAAEIGEVQDRAAGDGAGRDGLRRHGG